MAKIIRGTRGLSGVVTLKGGQQGLRKVRCQSCHGTAVEQVRPDGKKLYICACGAQYLMTAMLLRLEEPGVLGHSRHSEARLAVKTLGGLVHLPDEEHHGPRVNESGFSKKRFAKTSALEVWVNSKASEIVKGSGPDQRVPRKLPPFDRQQAPANGELLTHGARAQAVLAKEPQIELADLFCVSWGSWLKSHRVECYFLGYESSGGQGR